MDDQSQEILDSLPQRTSRSRLAPYRELIHELRRRRRTYREIAQVLAEKCQCTISISTLHDFVRLRARAKRASAKHQLPETIQQAGVNPVKKPQRKIEEETGESARLQIVEVQERIAALKRRAKPVEAHAVRFQFDPTQPLHLPPQIDRSRDNKK